MKEKVVYLLGAGFSAPLGLPVMSDFLFKSRDQYFAVPADYSYFAEVFEVIRKLADVKNYFKADLFNIEEILSILEMQRHLGRGEAESHDYIKYLCDVVQYYTPAFSVVNQVSINWYNNWLGDKKTLFGNFVACLFNLEVKDVRANSPKKRLFASREKDSQTMYSVVTLNYDLVLEKLCEQIRSIMQTDVDFSTGGEVEAGWLLAPYLAKLHGTVASGKIIPPTWNKGLHPEIAEVWKRAYKLFSTATQIRVVGYSLPETDAYVKYLLKSAVTEARNLKQIDVICLDPKGDVKVRYDEFIDFPNYKFASIDVLEYLSHKFPSSQQDHTAKFDFLEKLHHGVSWK